MVTITREQAMGKVIVPITVTNGYDLDRIADGTLDPKRLRSVTIDALVDTGATLLMLPNEICQRLGLRETRKSRSKVADGRIVERAIYGPVCLKVLGREVYVEAAGLSGDMPALLGQIPLEGLDYHIDPKGQRLIPNPESPDMAMIEVF